VVGQRRGGLGHAPAVAGEGDQEIVPALVAPRPGKSMGQDGAFQIASQLAFGLGRDAFLLPADKGNGFIS